MNQNTLNFISEHWQLLLNPSAEEFAALISYSPLQSVALIIQALIDEPLSLQELSDRTGLHENSVKEIVRLLDTKLFDRSARSFKKGASVLVSLSVSAVEGLSSAPKLNSASHTPEKAGKYRAVLPDKKFYRAIQSNKEGKWLFEDVDSKTFRIVSTVPDPWEKEWAIWAAKQRQKNNGEYFYTHVDLRLYPLDQMDTDVPSVKIIRERIDGYFAWAINRPHEFFAMQITRGLYLSYDFVPR